VSAFTHRVKTSACTALAFAESLPGTVSTLETRALALGGALSPGGACFKPWLMFPLGQRARQVMFLKTQESVLQWNSLLRNKNTEGIHVPPEEKISSHPISSSWELGVQVTYTIHVD